MTALPVINDRTNCDTFSGFNLLNIHGTMALGGAFIPTKTYPSFAARLHGI